MRLKEYVDYKYSLFKEKELFVLEDENDTPRKEVICDCTSYLVRSNLQRDIKILSTIYDKDIIILERNVF